MARTSRSGSSPSETELRVARPQRSQVTAQETPMLSSGMRRALDEIGDGASINLLWYWHAMITVGGFRIEKSKLGPGSIKHILDTIIQT
jgi:hypothetical protein